MKREFARGLLLKMIQVGIVFVCTPYIQAQLAPFVTPTGTTPVTNTPAQNTVSILAQQGSLIQTVGSFL